MYDFDEARDRIAQARHLTNASERERTLSQIGTEAQVEIAASLGDIAEALDRLAGIQRQSAYLPGIDPALLEQDVPPHDWAIGDVVVFGDGDEEFHIDELGLDQGEQWARLIDDDGETTNKMWVDRLTFIHHDLDPEPSHPLEGVEVSGEGHIVEHPVDDPDVDFDDDAFAKLKASKKKAAKK